MAVSMLSALLVVYLFVRRLIVGPEAEGCSRCSRIVFFLIGLALFGIGLLGEYVGRIYAQVRERPRYIVEAVLEEGGAASPSRRRQTPVAPPPRRRERTAVTRAVVFAYSEVGVRCVRELLAQDVEIPLLFTHADDPGESRWFGSVEELARAARAARRDARGSEHARVARRGARARAPDFLFSFYYRHMLSAGVARGAAARRPEHARLAAAEIPRPRAGALGDHSTARPVTGASLHYMLGEARCRRARRSAARADSGERHRARGVDARSRRRRSRCCGAACRD